MAMKTLATFVAAALAVPAVALAQTVYVEKPAHAVTGNAYVVERITVYDAPTYYTFVKDESGALQSGGNTLDDILLADSVAMAIARDRKLDGVTATVSASNGRVSVTGLGDVDQSSRALAAAQRIAGVGNVSGALSNDGG
jgi:osmotically-inducible protein OsmY